MWAGMGDPQILPGGLDAEQLAAVQREGQDVCVVAGPGSGKTRVLVERFAWLVERGCDPERILAITFTEKAANELKQRLAQRFASQPEKRRKVERAQISTIHAFCHAVLREHALEAGLDPQFEVLDEMQAAALRLEMMSRTLDAVARKSPVAFARLAEVWPAADMAGALLKVHDAMRAAGGLEEALGAPAGDEDIAQLQRECVERIAEAVQQAQPTTPNRKARLALLRELEQEAKRLEPRELESRLKKIKLTGAEKGVSDAVKLAREAAGQAVSSWLLETYRAQRQLLTDVLRDYDDESRKARRELGVLDYSDLEEHALRLLRENDTARRAVMERYEHILMDELQDTNPLQWKIVEQVRSPGRFFAVGDVNQSIYGFRYAEPALFREYQRKLEDSNWAVDRLSRNYRTRAEILESVRRILVEGQRPGIEPHAFQPQTAYGDGQRPFVEVFCAVSEGRMDEAPEVMPWVAARLLELYGTPLASENRPACFSDMAVFVRNSNSFDAVEQALKRYSIPYVITGGKTFFDAQEVVDLINVLRVLAAPEDKIALFSLLRSPIFGVSDEELFRRRLRKEWLTEDEETQIAELRSLAESLPLSAVLARLADASGYAAQLTAAGQANVEKLLALIDGLEQRHGRGVVEILSEIEILKESSQEANASAPESGDAVQLMTIHKAKGLEFPIVVVAALEKRERHETAPALYHPDCGLGFRWVLPDGERRGDRIHEEAKQGIDKKNGLERDRLLYVALTRAKERLILCFTKSAQGLEEWPRMILEGLHLEIPAERGNQSANELAVVRRVAGLPDAPQTLARAAGAAPVEIERTETLGEAPAEVAVTALATFLRCPRQYFLQSVLHWPTAPTGGGEGIELGTEVHEFLAGVRQEVSAEALELARVFQESELAKRAERAPERKREQDFLVEVEGTLVRGQIDLWFDEGRGPVLIDYKTDQYLNGHRTQAYELQMRLYAAALEKLRGKPVSEAWLFSLREGQPHRVDVSAESMGEALDVLRQWQEAERKGEFPTRESDDCQWCPFAAGPCPVRPPRRPGL